MFMFLSCEAGAEIANYEYDSGSPKIISSFDAIAYGRNTAFK